MESSKYYLAAILCLMVTCIEGVKVSDTSCTSGGNQCSSITGSTCVNNKCKCSTGFAEDTSDGSTCVKVVSATACTSGGTECNGITNSACDVPNLKCKCSAGYGEVVNTCVKVVSATACTSGGSECSGITNSACDVPNLKCKCSAGYGEVLNTCVKVVSATACTSGGSECSGITNSACDVPNLKCKCSAGYTEDVNTCVKATNNAQTNAGTKVSNTVCTVGGSECVAHSVCENLKCKCSAGFVENTADGSTCVQVTVVSATVCTNQGTECNAINNSACDVPSLKCKCNTGFTENANTCVKGSSGSSASTTRVTVGTMTVSMILFFSFRRLYM